MVVEHPEPQGVLVRPEVGWVHTSRCPAACFLCVDSSGLCGFPSIIGVPILPSDGPVEEQPEDLAHSARRLLLLVHNSVSISVSSLTGPVPARLPDKVDGVHLIEVEVEITGSSND